MSFLAHFRKKLTFYFASPDFNFGNFVMELTWEEVNIVTYLYVLEIGNWLKIKSYMAKKNQEKIQKFWQILNMLEIGYWLKIRSFMAKKTRKNLKILALKKSKKFF